MKTDTVLEKCQYKWKESWIFYEHHYAMPAKLHCNIVTHFWNFKMKQVPVIFSIWSKLLKKLKWAVTSASSILSQTDIHLTAVQMQHKASLTPLPIRLFLSGPTSEESRKWEHLHHWWWWWFYFKTLRNHMVYNDVYATAKQGVWLTSTDCWL